MDEIQRTGDAGGAGMTNAQFWIIVVLLVLNLFRPWPCYKVYRR